MIFSYYQGDVNYAALITVIRKNISCPSYCVELKNLIKPQARE